MDLPGVDKNDIDLKVYRDRVEVKAHRSTQECLKEEDCDSVQAGGEGKAIAISDGSQP